jgi:uncharacterized protein YlaI
MTKYGDLCEVERMCSWCGEVKFADNFRVYRNRYRKPQRVTLCRPCESRRAMGKPKTITAEMSSELQHRRNRYVAEKAAVRAAAKRERHLMKK